MPKMKPDRNDSQGNMTGQGGSQIGEIGHGTSMDRQGQPSEQLEPAGGTLGAGGQRNPDGSSRDPDRQGRDRGDRR